MAKIRKTRKQKKLADLRHITPSISSQDSLQKSDVYTFTPQERPSQQAKIQSTVISVADYQYIKKDLFKITLLTSCIVIAELFLSYLLKSI